MSEGIAHSGAWTIALIMIVVASWVFYRYTRSKEEAPMQTMTIGKLAKLAGVNTDTIRYYERKGLLPPAVRRPSGYREYDAADVDRLHFIRRSKDLGFTLAEIAELLALTGDRNADMQGMKRRAEQRLEHVEHKLRELRRMRRGLKELLAACPGHGELHGCPIVATLSQNESPGRKSR